MDSNIAIGSEPSTTHPNPSLPTNTHTHTLLTFTCYHFAIVPNTSHLPALDLSKSCNPIRSILDLCAKPTTAHIPLPTTCSSPQCQDSLLPQSPSLSSSPSSSSSSSSYSSSFFLSSRSLHHISQTSAVLEAKLSEYLRLGKTYHSLPFSLRAALSEIPECALAHEQFGGIKTLFWDSDPFFEPYLSASRLLGEAAKMIEEEEEEEEEGGKRGGSMTGEMDGEIRGKVNAARMQIGKLVRLVGEVRVGVELVEGYSGEEGDGEEIGEKEGRLRVRAAKEGIRRGWLFRLGEIEGAVA